MAIRISPDPDTHRDSDETGASMVEYALLVVLISVIALVAIVLVGENVSTTFSTVSSELTQ